MMSERMEKEEKQVLICVIKPSIVCWRDERHPRDVRDSIEEMIIFSFFSFASRFEFMIKSLETSATPPAKCLLFKI
jgi:hypothetical protein